MFVYTIGDILWVGMIILIVIIGSYKFIRYRYLKKKYSKCPVCGEKSANITEVKYLFGDMESYEKFWCSKCKWEEKLKF